MRYALLIALREYLENAKTKGFWIGIALFPIILFVMTKLPTVLEKNAVPTRYFSVVDRSGEFEEKIKEALKRDHSRQIARELFVYMQRYTKPSATTVKVDLEKQPAATLPKDLTNPDPQKMIEESGISFDLIADGVQKEGTSNFLQKNARLLREDRPPFEEPRERFVYVDLPKDVSVNLEEPELIERLKPYLFGEKKIWIDEAPRDLFAVVLIPKDIQAAILRPGNLMNLLPAAKSNGVKFWCINQADTDLSELIERSINDEVRRREYEAQKVDRKTVDNVQGTKIAYASLNPKKKEGEQEVSVADKVRQWAPTVLVYLLWVALMTVAQMLLNNTIEEKSNRIVEVLLSSVTPGELMMGKMIGIASVGLTMLLAWTISFLGLFYFDIAGEKSQLAVEIFNVMRSSGLLPAFFIYFVFGYLVYAGIFLAMGSVCNTLKEAQNMMGPSMLIMMVPLVTMMFIPKDPNGTLATVLSWVPLYTPFIMMNRAAADPPLFDVVGTFILMTVFTIFVLWLAGKIFKIGILRTGQPPKFMELLRWLKN